MQRFCRFAWGVTAYNILVVLWGAWVRISGSGAGCGDHWPDCNGQLIPQTDSVQTLIEFTHRLTSGLCGILVLAMTIWAFRVAPKGHRVRLAAMVTLIFVILEGALGAALVKLGLVDKNQSVLRAVVVGIHLVNTFMLLGAGALTAWWAGGHPGPNLRAPGRWAFGFALLGLLLVGMSGAVTALGDTLFPVDPTAGEGLFARLRDDLSAGQHFLVRLRIVHPILAIGVGIGLLAMSSARLDTSPGPARAVLWLVVVQLVAGSLNIALAAPGWMQIVHLLLADLVLIAVVILASESLADPRGLR